MYRFDPDHYLNRPTVLLTQQRRRSLRRFHVNIGGIEPRAKHSMALGHKIDIQRHLLQRLTALHRRAFQGPVAVRLVCETSERNPTQLHHIAKNMLDLFGKPLPELESRRRGLLYSDDGQIYALSVSCRHGQAAPKIAGFVAPLGCVLKDLAVLMDSDVEPEWDPSVAELSFGLDRAGDAILDLRRDEEHFRGKLGDHGFESMMLFFRQQAQEGLLGQAAITTRDLGWMYDVSGRGSASDFGIDWDRMFAERPVRIELSELPQVKGGSSLWKQEIDEKLRDFQSKWRKLIDPLLIPVALEVVVKPPPISRQTNVHDLDNIVRSYLIPRVVEILKPISHIAFALDAQALERAAPSLLCHPHHVKRLREMQTPPKSTRAGVTRYELWRLPPATEGSAGFVSVAIIADLAGHDDALRKIDRGIEKWRTSLE